MYVYVYVHMQIYIYIYIYIYICNMHVQDRPMSNIIYIRSLVKCISQSEPYRKGSSDSSFIRRAALKSSDCIRTMSSGLWVCPKALSHE